MFKCIVVRSVSFNLFNPRLYVRITISWNFSFQPSFETFYREGEKRRKKRKKRKVGRKCQAVNKMAKGERDILPRSKLHYKPLNLIFSLHSREV